MRGTGTTIQQLLGAPKGALFIHCNRYTEYPKSLCKRIGREDIKVVGVQVLSDDEYMCLHGEYWPAIIVDHATEGSAERHRVFAHIVKYYVRCSDANFVDMQERIGKEYEIRPQDFK